MINTSAIATLAVKSLQKKHKYNGKKSSEGNTIYILICMTKRNILLSIFEGHELEVQLLGLTFQSYNMHA